MRTTDVIKNLRRTADGYRWLSVNSRGEETPMLSSPTGIYAIAGGGGYIRLSSVHLPKDKAETRRILERLM